MFAFHTLHRVVPLWNSRNRLGIVPPPLFVPSTIAAININTDR